MKQQLLELTLSKVLDLNTKVLEHMKKGEWTEAQSCAEDIQVILNGR